jgi:type II secretory pathway predicted ATPase ExeA
LFHQVQERIASLSVHKNQVPVIVADKAQHLRHELLHDLQMIFNFNMDSKNPAMVILCGTPTIVPMLKIHVHEGLLERVIVHHEFSGLEPDEADPYVKAMLKAAGATSPIFTPDAVTAVFEAARGKPRLINALAGKCLLLGYVREARAIDSKIVQHAAMDGLQVPARP